MSHPLFGIMPSIDDPSVDDPEACPGNIPTAPEIEILTEHGEETSATGGAANNETEEELAQRLEQLKDKSHM